MLARSLVLLALAFLHAAPALADEYADALKSFRHAGQSAEFFKKAHGYAIFPTIGKGGVGLGASAGASGGRNDAATVGKYYKGMATFTIAKGGLMYQAAIGGPKFSYKAR